MKILQYHINSFIYKASVPLLLKKMSDDLDYLKESLNIVRENAIFMAKHSLSLALQKLDEYKFEEVWLS